MHHQIHLQVLIGASNWVIIETSGAYKQQQHLVISVWRCPIALPTRTKPSGGYYWSSHQTDLLRAKNVLLEICSPHDHLLNMYLHRKKASIPTLLKPGRWRSALQNTLHVSAPITL